MSRAMLIGLDCAPPALVFDRLQSKLPVLSRLIARGAHGPLRSVLPPITMPAWACMLSGRDPGELGVYGFRARGEGYALRTHDARDISCDRVWDLAGRAGKKVAVLYVPPTYPPREVNGVLVSCMLTPGPDAVHTFPESLGASLRARFGPHAPDVPDYRASEPEALLDQLYRTSRHRFSVARAIWREERPDLMCFVELGLDRLHHALWVHLDPSHPEHDPSHRLVREARDYYAFIDSQVGLLIDEVDLDEAAVIVASDHGARSLRAGVAVNEWLRRHGWLVLREEPAGPAPLTPARIDWPKTRAWAEAGYYARVFFNVEGREPEGIVKAQALDDEVEEVARLLEALPGGARAHRPQNLYRKVNGRPPELMVILADLDHRAVGTVGGPILTERDDRGPDACNHDWDGVFIEAGAGVRARGALHGCAIHDVGATLLALLEIERPADWLGRDRSAG